MYMGSSQTRHSPRKLSTTDALCSEALVKREQPDLVPFALVPSRCQESLPSIWINWNQLSFIQFCFQQILFLFHFQPAPATTTITELFFMFSSLCHFFPKRSIRRMKHIKLLRTVSFRFENKLQKRTLMCSWKVKRLWMCKGRNYRSDWTQTRCTQIVVFSCHRFYYSRVTCTINLLAKRITSDVEWCWARRN